MISVNDTTTAQSFIGKTIQFVKDVIPEWECTNSAIKTKRGKETSFRAVFGDDPFFKM